MFLRCVQTDILKIKRQPLLWMHLIVPLLGVSVFLAYYAVGVWTTEDKITMFLVTSAVAFPTLIGIVCSMAAELEAGAGQYQLMLTLPHKLIPFLSKLFVLLLMGFVSALFTTVGFGIGFCYLLHCQAFNILFYFLSACILFGGNIFLYVFHLAASLRLGRGASIGIGIVESLLAFILVSNVGDGKWPYIPCAWGVRFIQNFVQNRLVGSTVFSGLRIGMECCIIGTTVVIILASLWFQRWEGRQAQE